MLIIIGIPMDSAKSVRPVLPGDSRIESTNQCCLWAVGLGRLPL